MEHIKSILKLIAILLASGIVGLLLLVAANLLPSDRIKAHISDGAFVILQESAEFEYAEGYVSAILDNYTDAVILSKTAWPSVHPLEDAINVPSYAWPGQSAEGMEIFGYLNDNSLEAAQIDIYPRYWHGYMAILRPFFTIFGYADLRIINQMAQITLLVMVICSMIRRRIGRYLPAFMAMILLWNPATMGVSLQYSPCYYVSMIVSLVILAGAWRQDGAKHAQQDKDSLSGEVWFRESLLFMMSGIVTAYLDFLTYPLVTLGVPLITLFLVRMRADNDPIGTFAGNVWQAILTMLRLSVCWTVGYIGMWAEKWIYGSILTGTNILADAAGAVSARTAADNGAETISRIGTVLYLIKRTFGNWGASSLCLQQ